MDLAQKKKAAVDLDMGVLQATKVLAADSRKQDSQVVEDALRSYIGLEAVESAWARGDLSEKEALGLAYDQLHRVRRRIS